MTLPAQRTGSTELEPWIGYIRVSTWKEEKISPELQRRAIEEWAARKRRRIVRWIVDLDATGRNFKRKIMQGIAAVEAREARGIAVWKYSRFGRERHGIAVNLARVEHIGGRVESATEEIDASTALGRFQRGMLFEFAAFESDRAGEQWKETHQHRRDLKLPATGRPRFGYTWHRRYDPATGKIQEERYDADADDTGPVLAELYRQYVDGRGFPQLAAHLNDNGYRTTRGYRWGPDTLKHYMDSGFPAGLLRVHDPQCPCPGRDGGCTRHLLAEGAHEPLISDDLWLAYLARRKQVRSLPPRARTSTYLLTGLVACGGCRWGCSAHSAIRGGEKVKGWALRCNGRIKRPGADACLGVWARRDDVEERVFEWLRKHAADIDGAPSDSPERTEVDRHRAHAAAELQRLDTERTAIAAAIKRLIKDNALHPDKYPKGAFAEARDELLADQTRIELRMSELAQVAEQPDQMKYTPVVVGLIAEWPTLLVTERAAILRQLVRRVALYRTPGSGYRVEVHPVWEPDPWADAEQQVVDGADLAAVEQVDLTDTAVRVF